MFYPRRIAFGLISHSLLSLASREEKAHPVIHEIGYSSVLCSASLRTVKRGSGLRTQRSKEGWMRHELCRIGR